MPSGALTHSSGVCRTRWWRSLAVGSEVRVPVLGGGERRYVNLDNAASTPPFRRVLRKVNRFTRWYSNVHRGTGFKSGLSSWAYEGAREAVRGFVNAAESDVVLFPRSTTHAINHLAGRLPLDQRRVVLVSSMEHHSNDLPWRKVSEVHHVRVDDGGNIDESHLQELLRLHRDRVALLAMSGGSNVTGVVTPIHCYARWAHEAGARILVDAAQLAPHRPIDMRPADDPEHIDFLAFSAHKMYAPFGAGVLIGPASIFEDGTPHEVGGGTVEIVSTDRVMWTALPEREEAGTPCVVGAVALSAAIEAYRRLGWARLLQHESALVHRALVRLSRVPGLVIYGDSDPDHSDDRLGVISFNLGNMPHAMLSAVLSHEWGIGTRSGCFCAHLYVKHLLGIGEAGARDMERRIEAGDRASIPGCVRVSVGVYNTLEDIGLLGDALDAIAAGRIAGDYRLDPRTGEYHTDLSYDYRDYFNA